MRAGKNQICHVSQSECRSDKTCHNNIIMPLNVRHWPTLIASHYHQDDDLSGGLGVNTQNPSVVATC